MHSLVWIVLLFGVIGLLAYHRASRSVLAVGIGFYLILLSALSHINLIMMLIYWVLFGLACVVLFDKQTQQKLLAPIYKNMGKLMPTLSPTERAGLESGTVGWEGQLFAGMPNWSQLLAYPKAKLSKSEQAFIDGPVTQLCTMTDEWDLTAYQLSIPDKLWAFMKSEGFFGLIIPKKYGGKGFSAYAHALILSKLAGVSASVASTVSVPNSLGPAELLLEYGTQAQRDYYLPKLAKGEEIPCFALTGPDVGSDATSMPDHGTICERVINGEKIIGISLNFNKRYITLGPVATVIGLAFKLFDPDNLMSKKKNLGITVALVPANTKGVEHGRRHFPLNAVFPNGPVRGKDVFVPIDAIIGGFKMAGKGWNMLVERLAVGRAISLPSISLGGAQMAVAVSGAYARIREQFGLPIGRFGGVEERLARMAGMSYIMNATRNFTVAAIDGGEAPAVPSAISKYHLTEMGRTVVIDAMDIHGGKGICLGPKNYLGRGYQQAPIGITVEGANILTRSMIIFGQGAIRCHPHILNEISAVANEDKKAGLEQFSSEVFAHSGYLLSNLIRSFWCGLLNAKFSSAPESSVKHYYQQLNRISASFALISDACMIYLGGVMKRKEKLSGRLGDVLSMCYLASAVLKQFHERKEPQDELPLVQWSCQYLLTQAEQQLDGVIRNFPNKIVRGILRVAIFPLGRWNKLPTDRLVSQLGKIMLTPNRVRSQLIEGVYLPEDRIHVPGMLETALKMVTKHQTTFNKLNKAIKSGEVSGLTFEERIDHAEELKILNKTQASHLREYNTLREIIISVDDFSDDELRGVK
ncbi:MAG: acyl-CoA dehydrogenase [Gammaproteobacteria bacterium]|nr:acyl-CoA dehydrogenase [Gammaproteobacteria bacterium]